MKLIFWKSALRDHGNHLLKQPFYNKKVDYQRADPRPHGGSPNS